MLSDQEKVQCAGQALGVGILIALDAGMTKEEIAAQFMTALKLLRPDLPIPEVWRS